MNFELSSNNILMIAIVLVVIYFIWMFWKYITTPMVAPTPPMKYFAKPLAQQLPSGFPKLAASRTKGKIVNPDISNTPEVVSTSNTGVAQRSEAGKLPSRSSNAVSSGDFNSNTEEEEFYA
jgi:hypothetical protein